MCVFSLLFRFVLFAFPRVVGCSREVPRNDQSALLCSAFRSVVCQQQDRKKRRDRGRSKRSNRKQPDQSTTGSMFGFRSFVSVHLLFASANTNRIDRVANRLSSNCGDVCQIREIWDWSFFRAAFGIRALVQSVCLAPLPDSIRVENASITKEHRDEPRERERETRNTVATNDTLAIHKYAGIIRHLLLSCCDRRDCCFCCLCKAASSDGLLLLLPSLLLLLLLYRLGGARYIGPEGRLVSSSLVALCWW